MKKTDSHAFVAQILLPTIGFLCTGAVVGMGVVWIRHQISVTANHITATEARIKDVERRLAESAAAIEAEQGPEALKQRNEQWKLGLQPIREDQVMRVSVNVESRLASKRNQGLFTDGPTFVSLKLQKN